MSKSVLVIENDPDLAESLAVNLDGAGYRVLGPTARGIDALRICEETLPDAALVDVRLDDQIDGIFLGQELAERGVAVIYLTGYFDRAASEARHHAAGLLSKPLLAADLTQALERALSRGAGSQA